MLYSTIFPAGGVDEKYLRNLATELSRISGQRIEVAMQLVVTTEDTNVSVIFDTLRDVIGGEQPVKVNHRKNGHKKVKAAVAKSDGMTSHSRRNVETGEILSTQALHKMVAADTIWAGTVWGDIKGQRFVVVDGELVKEPQS